MRTGRIRRPASLPTVVASASAAALVFGIVFAPTGSPVEAMGVFGSLRSPGEFGVLASHRGDSGNAPENTLPAIAAALASSAALVEVDVQLTADDVPILMHDFFLDRTTDGDGPVWEATWEQIRRLDAGSWYSSAFAGTPVPRFEEFLGLLAGSGKSAIVELKGSWTMEQVAIVTRLVSAWDLDDRVLLASFDLMTLQAARDVAPEMLRALISREVNGDPADLARACGAAAIVTSKRFVREQPDVIERIHAAGLGAFVYTLNDEEGWAEAIALGVDGIITDHPTEFERWMAEVDERVGG